MSDNYLCILSFLKKYSGNQYKSIEKCVTDQERMYMTDGSNSGKKARTTFESLVKTIETKYGFEHDRITQWQNSGVFVSYFWCQMKRPEKKESQISLSLFAEKNGGNFRFRLSIELAVGKATKNDFLVYRHLLDIPLHEDLIYISGGNNESEFKELSERNNEIVKQLGLKKVQVSFIYNEDQYVDDNVFEATLLNAAYILIPYYDSIFLISNETIIKPFYSKTHEGNKSIPLSIKETINRIKAYISAKGFTYEDGMIENFYLSLKSKPFVILAGISGTGKTRLVKLFAEAIGAEYRLVPVRPDWSDPSDLLGHHNLEGDFVPGRVLKIILEAMKDPEKPYILCLDEMNLARVEYYLSDFLSIIETRDLKDGRIVSDRLLPFEIYGDIRFPENLYLAGTVNMDETTFPFSKKVLDRANTIEFNTVDLMPSPKTPDSLPEPVSAGNDFLKSEYLFLDQCLDEENYDFAESVCQELETLNRILRKNNAHVGYRVRDEIVFYMLNNRNAGLLSRDEALDNAVMQKILPRLQGSSMALKETLCELFKAFAGDYDGYQTQSGDTASGMFAKLEEGNIRYPKCAAKTAFMVRRFEEDGFTAYWL